MRPSLPLFPGLLCDARLWRDQVEAPSGTVACVADCTQDDSLDAMAPRARSAMSGQLMEWPAEATELLRTWFDATLTPPPRPAKL